MIYYDHKEFLELCHTLNEDDRRTMLFALAYQQVRRESEDPGFFVFRGSDFQDIVAHRTFKTFTTIRNWFEKATKVLISYKDMFWVSYIRSVFEACKPSFPHPGQLKNDKLLVEFMRRVESKEVKPTDADKQKISDLYSRIFRVQGEAYGLNVSGKINGSQHCFDR